MDGVAFALLELFRHRLFCEMLNTESMISILLQIALVRSQQEMV